MHIVLLCNHLCCNVYLSIYVYTCCVILNLQSMTLTNYTDVERELVKDMLHICGLPYTGHLSRENTHLICKR